ncbi:MAG: hypothetical protein OXE52_06055 [Chloroflexi bacterium]|nr:hypothetical protein [Chloroflexota bacterium]
MKLAILTFLAVIATVVSAQDTGSPDSNDGEAPTVETAVPGMNDADDGIVVALATPFLQDDLHLLVGNVQRPNAMVWFEDYLYTVCNGDWTIYQIDDRNGDTITYVFGIKNGHSMLMESTEEGFDLWVPDPESETLWKVNQNRLAPVSVFDQLAAPWGIARMDEDSLLVTDTRENAIIQVTEAGEALTIASGLRSPTGIAIDESRIYFANGGSARRGIEWMQIEEDGAISGPKPLVNGLQNTTNIILGDDGLLYFGYALGTRAVVGRINPEHCLEHGCSGDETEMVVFSDIPAPVTLALSPDLRLYLHSRFRPEVYWAQLPT